MAGSEYNGWTNYATWRVHLEVIDGVEPPDDLRNLRALRDWLQEYAEDEVLGGGVIETRAGGFASAFMADVDWWQITRSVAARFGLFLPE